MNKSSIIAYPAIFESEENGVYTVRFPDILGCFAQGDTFEEALLNAQEALAIFYYETKGELIRPSSIFDIIESHPDSIVQMIYVNSDDYKLKMLSTKCVRKNLTIPEWLNDLSEKYGMNFSNVLKEALIESLKNNMNVTPYEKLILSK